jgi:DNA-binding beta-propeller fold protein YncE
VFDTSNNSFVAAIHVSGTYVFLDRINPDGKHAYVTTDSNVTLIDLAATRWWAQLL